MYTRSTPTAEAIAQRKWWVVDLEGQTVGRAATRIAHILRGGSFMGDRAVKSEKAGWVTTSRSPSSARLRSSCS